MGNVSRIDSILFGSRQIIKRVVDHFRQLIVALVKYNGFLCYKRSAISDLNISKSQTLNLDLLGILFFQEVYQVHIINFYHQERHFLPHSFRAISDMYPQLICLAS